MFARHSLPDVSGQVKLQGLSAPVNVFRDDRGVPHIEASTSHDLYMAQGYVTAQDRLWEMDVSRRAASGRLSEVLGGGVLETDKYFRSMLLRRSAEKSWETYSPWARDALNAFADGVNAYIQEATSSSSLPVEFTLLGYKPEPWTAVDSLSIAKVMAHDLSGNVRTEVFYYMLRQAVGDDLTKQVMPIYPSNAPTIMANSTAEESARRYAQLPPDESHIDLSGLLAAASFPNEFVGSNNWVVSGKLTASGKPLLANDPHLALRTPSIWYQTHLVLNGKDEKMNVIGVTFPGAPGVVVGHNDKVAWGVTNTGPDVQDLYIEKRNPQNPYQFEYMGKWEDATVYKEQIKVKGKPDVPYEIVVTRHGPIISEVTGLPGVRPKEALALRWTAHMPTPDMEAVLAWDKATNWSEFRTALQKFSTPTQNFVFASVDGTIAYRANGMIPIRAKGDGIAPVPGWTDEYEWKGFIPFDAIPEIVNPTAGFIASANNKVIDDSYPYMIAREWAPPYRASRITEVLKSKPGLTVDDMRLLQVDYKDLQAAWLTPALLSKLDKKGLSETEQKAAALLESWDYVEGSDQGAPLLYQLWWKHLNLLLYSPKMGSDIYRLMTNKVLITDDMIKQAVQGQESDWIKAAGGIGALTLNSFKAAVANAVTLQGNNPQSWSWGKFHQIYEAHPVGGSVKPLGWFLNPSLTPVGGSANTVGAMSFLESGMVTHAASWRQVVDLSNLAGNSFDIVSPGQSGHFLSPWYDDQAPDHAKGALRPQIMDSATYSKGKKLSLTP